MSVPTYDFVWQQGEDGEINLVYSAGEPAVPVDLTGYSVRMDVRVPGGSSTLYTFNSNDANVTTTDEATLGADGTIHILIPRSVSLPNGELAAYINQPLAYDIFLRDATNKQRKLIEGTVKFEPSATLWV